MRIYVDGEEVRLSNVNEYSLGPLRLFVKEDLADSYNRVVQAYIDAKKEAEKYYGRPWEPGMDLKPIVSYDDLQVFIGLGLGIEETALYYDGPPVTLTDLQDLFLVVIEEET